ncbi:MAG: ferric reductase-like transmembrane domain-containing protein, partial [Proteobacteria bacterium]|nr:ferric reductase-like transmembrane domain-containing protein [Pseudomonadota bacterium]
MAGRRALGIVIVAACLAPALRLAWQAAFGDLGANPIETVEHATGEWALRLLLATLAVTPVRRLAGWQAIATQRRTLGLFAFAYVVAHFFTWSVLDNELEWASIVEDIAKRPFVTVGFTAFVLLIPLAATSTRASIKRLGKRWVKLHRLVYVAAALGVLHFFWLVKKDLRPPLVNSVTFCETERYARLLERRRERVFSVVCLLVGKEGPLKSTAEMVAAARQLFARCAAAGFQPAELFFDTVTLGIGTDG